ncbi:MAG: VOC family protein, partial [Pseudoclavibacter sp.]
MLRGLANLNLVADDMGAAIEWYAGVFGEQPYFVRPETGEPQYAEWRFGDDDDEFALMSSAFRPALAEPGGAV